MNENIHDHVEWTEEQFRTVYEENLPQFTNQVPTINGQNTSGKMLITCFNFFRENNLSR